MALDNAQFIAELSITDPPGTDPLSQGDDHIRTVKRATQQSFPLIDKAVNLTADQLNLAAIKNEANVFTVNQTLANASMVIDDTLDADLFSYFFFSAGLASWGLSNDNLTVASESKLRMRRWIAGVAQADVFTVDNATGILDFTSVPTVQGDPLWIPGEVKMLVQGAALPSNNWFLCNGMNGTVDLRDRIMGAQGTFTGTQSPFLDVQTDPGSMVGATAISEAQMPAHNHSVYMTNSSAGGITDAPINATDNVFGGRRNDSSKQFSKSNGTREVMGDAGSGAGHDHTIPELECNPAGSDAFQVMPYTYFMQAIQYVP